MDKSNIFYHLNNIHQYMINKYLHLYTLYMVININYMFNLLNNVLNHMMYKSYYHYNLYMGPYNFNMFYYLNIKFMYILYNMLLIHNTQHMNYHIFDILHYPNHNNIQNYNYKLCKFHINNS
jgi:hypothetical protein